MRKEIGILRIPAGFRNLADCGVFIAESFNRMAVPLNELYPDVEPPDSITEVRRTYTWTIFCVLKLQHTPIL